MCAMRAAELNISHYLSYLPILPSSMKPTVLLGLINVCLRPFIPTAHLLTSDTGGPTLGTHMNVTRPWFWRNPGRKVDREV